MFRVLCAQAVNQLRFEGFELRPVQSSTSRVAYEVFRSGIAASLPDDLIERINPQQLCLGQEESGFFIRNLGAEQVEILDVDHFLHVLRWWQEDPAEAGNRVEASSRIVEALRTNATELYLSDLGLTNLPSIIGRLTCLNELHLDGNRLQILPDKLASLKNLTTLILFDNDLETIPSAVFELPLLSDLNLGCNKLIAVPPQIGRLTQLRFLNLATNQLESVADEFWQLHNLRALTLNGNQFETFPEQMSALIHLRTLNIGYCSLDELPASLTALSGLYEIDIDESHIPADQVAALLKVISSARLEGYTDVALSDRLLLWSKFAGQVFCFLPQRLEEQQKMALSEFLYRLTQVRDFGTTQQYFAVTLCRMIQDLTGVGEWNPQWREAFFSQISADNLARSDSGVMAFYELHIKWMSLKPFVGSATQRLEHYLAIARTIVLRKAISKALAGRELGENVEAFFYYELQAQTHMKLASAITDMKYPARGSRDFINPWGLFEDANLFAAEELRSLPGFLSYLEEQPELAGRFETIDREIGQELSKCTENTADYLTCIEGLRRLRCKQYYDALSSAGKRKADELSEDKPSKRKKLD